MSTIINFVGDSFAACSLVLMAAIAVGSWLVRNKDIKEEKK